MILLEAAPLRASGSALRLTVLCQRRLVVVHGLNRAFMKTHHLLLFILCCSLAACDRHSDASASTSGASASQMKEYNEQVKRQQAQLDAYDRQSKSADEQIRVRSNLQARADELLRSQEDTHKRADAIMVVQEQMLKRQQDDLARYEKILETWERQQKQYQTYLDSLGKK